MSDKSPIARPFPMFPLGTVLMPTAVLPLRVFEARYRALVTDCLAGDGEFGVTLIERGSEVGGGDVRTDLGTIAQILDARESPDGQWAVIAVGTRRFRVLEWLEEDPYPRALLEDWPEPPAEMDHERDRDAAMTLLQSIASATAELTGAELQTLPEIAADPALASHQIAALAPVGPLDRQRLLAAEGPAQRFVLLEGMLEEQLDVLRLRRDLDGG